jgi:hypothetical protein
MALDATGLGAVAGDPAAAADLLAAAAAACEPGTPGLLSQAARHMARAAQHAGQAPRPGSAAVISEMAGAFQAITQAGTGDVLTLVREVALLAGTIAATTRSRAATQASTLVNASLATLTQAAGQQAGVTMPVTIPAGRNPAKEDTMSELTHEDEFLAQLTAAGVMATRLTRAAASQPPGAGPADVGKLKAAGYTETTPYDEHLRRELGEQRWAWYVADRARIVCAAAITNAAQAGHDMPALLRTVCRRRGWEDDQTSPARSIARVLDYRIKREMTRLPSRHAATAAPHYQRTQAGRTHGGAPSTSRATTAKPRPPAGNPSPVTPWDGQLKNLLGRQRWDEYATDDRRRDIAARLTRAAADGHDIDALLTKAVTYRDWEDDPVSPSRRVASVLHYRVQGLIATGEYKTAGQDRQLPSEVAQAVGRSTAPARDHPGNGPHPARAGDAPPRPRSAQPRPGQGRG